MEGGITRPMCKFLDALQNSFSALEKIVWESLVATHQEMLSELLSQLDEELKEQRDKARYVLKDMKTREIATRVGPIRFKRSYYRDTETNEWVFLLDEHLGLEARSRTSELVREDAVTAAVSGKSYREAAAEIERQNTGVSASHESIRQWTINTGEVLEQQARLEAQKLNGKKQVPVLFIEADGFWVSIQKGKRQELRFAVVHEGWEARGRKEYALINRQDIFPPTGKDFWEYVSAVVESRYDLSQSFVVINGDRAAWIGKGTEWFLNALYQVDRFHLLREIRQNLRQQPELLKEAQAAVYADDPSALLETLVKAIPGAGLKQREQIQRLHKDITSRPDMVESYQSRLRKHGLELEGYRGMGSAEASVARFSGRLRRLGRSWSKRGIMAMAHAISGQGQGILRHAVTIMEQQLGLRELAKHVKQKTETLPESYGFNCSLPIMNSGRGASGGLSRLMHNISRGSLNPRFI